MSEEENSEEIDETIKKFFSNEQWDALSSYEKSSYSNARKNFEMLKSLGLNPKTPSFMSRGTINEDFQEDSNDSDNYESLVPADAEKMPAHIEKFVTKLPSKTPLRAEFSTAALFDGLVIPSKKDRFAIEEIKTNEDHSNGFMERYPKRTARKCYKEEDLEDEEEDVRRKADKDYDSKDDDEDDSLDDSDHDDNSDGDHKSRKRKRRSKRTVEPPLLPISMTWVPDKRNEINKTYSWKQRSLGSLPLCLTFAPSNADKDIVGVWTECWLAADLVFGPYEGRVFVRTDADEKKESYFVWQKQDLFSGYDGSDDRTSNWLGYVSYSETNPNLIAFQYKKQIYYRTYKPILPHTELLVWYADDYERDVSLSINAETTPVSKICTNQDVELDNKSATEFKKESDQDENSDVEIIEESNVDTDQDVGSVVKPLVESTVDIEKDSSLGAKQEMESVEPKPDTIELKCRPCSAHFSDADTLIRHKEEHKRLKVEAVRKFKCTICPFSHNHRGIFNHHKWMHSQKPKFTTCRQCNMPIKKKANLSTHLKVHSGVKRFACSLCSNIFFFRPHLLLNHNRTAHWQVKSSSDDELSS